MIRRPSFFYTPYKVSIANPIRDCHFLKTARKYEIMNDEKMKRQRRNIAVYTPRALLSLVTGTGGGASERGLSINFDTPLSRAEETQEIATMAGLSVEEVSTFVLRLEKPVRWTQRSVSAVMEFPYQHAHLLRQTVLGLWRDLDYLVWQYALGPGILIILIGLICGNGTLVASLLMGIGLCRLFSGLSFPVAVLCGTGICLLFKLYT